MIIESLDRIGFPGPIYPINPKHVSEYTVRTASGAGSAGPSSPARR